MVPQSEKETIQMYLDNLVIAYASVINSTTLVEMTGWRKLYKLSVGFLNGVLNILIVFFTSGSKIQDTLLSGKFFNGESERTFRTLNFSLNCRMCQF